MESNTPRMLHRVDVGVLVGVLALPVSNARSIGY